MLTNEEADVLAHTSRTGRYVTGEESVIDMGRRGLLYDHGPQRLVNGDHYFVMTSKGAEALREWREAQPKEAAPKPLTRSQRRYRDCCRVSECFDSFRQWLAWNTNKRMADILHRY